MKKYLQKGQSLIEMIIVLGVVAILVTSLISGSTRSIVSGRRSADKDIAIKLAQSGMEIVRGVRDANWDTFRAYDGTWCISDAGVFTSYDQGGTFDCPTLIEERYSRIAKFTWNETAGRMDVLITVFWRDEAYYYVELSSFFTQWK